MNKNINIPGRLHSVATDGQVAGANEIYDDDIQLTQAEINEIVIGGTMSNSLTATSPVKINVASTVNLNAVSTISMTNITISGGNISTPISGSGNSLSGSDSVTPTTLTPLQYTAVFTKGGYSQTKTATVRVVYPIYYGYGDTWEDAVTEAPAKTSPSGTYNINVETSGKSIFFVVPSTMTINSATMNGFTFPLNSPVTVTKNGVSYKYYQSSSTQDAGNYPIVIN